MKIGGIALLLFVTAILSGGLYYFFSENSGQHPLEVSEADRQRADELIEQRKKLDETVWAGEVKAQEFEDRFVDLWDALREAGDKLGVLAKFPFDELILPQWQPGESPGNDVQTMLAATANDSLAANEWLEKIEQWKSEGWELIQSEWHHSAFRAEERESDVSVTLHVANKKSGRRGILKGNLRVVWSSKKDDNKLWLPSTLDASDINVKFRDVRPAFTSLDAKADLRSDSFTALYDLDKDGQLELILGPNSILRWKEGRWNKEEIHPKIDDAMSCAVIGDINQDSFPDIVFASRNQPLYLLLGAAGGKFPEPPQEIPATSLLPRPSSLTLGDIDGDGDLDLYVTQYKNPYVKGQMPNPYFDANDGHPAYLLENKGEGKFVDITESAGLTEKRTRRSYSSSFVDLDGDHDLDLLVNSDFAGIDLYENDGKGKFRDVTDQWVDEKHNFGMSHTIADYNCDGKLDFFVAGMSSTTARRLEAMDLGRNDMLTHQQMRMKMGYGNRMYLSNSTGKFSEPDFRDRVARTGWSWGTTSFDFDNDADPDIYIANGHVSGRSAKDYCTRFWCHDIYETSSKPDLALDLVFKSENQLGDISWNGFEHNALLVNSGSSFFESGFLMNVAFEFDARGVLSGDIDRDGRLDLVVQESLKAGFHRVHVMRNQYESDNGWIGIQLNEEGNGKSPIGAVVKAELANGLKQIKPVVTGDSFTSQHSNWVHFGTGDQEVKSIEVRWPNGEVWRLDSPKRNQYYRAK